MRQIPRHLGTKHETVPTAKERVTLGPGSCSVEPESLADSWRSACSCFSVPLQTSQTAPQTDSSGIVQPVPGGQEPPCDMASRRPPVKGLPKEPDVELDSPYLAGICVFWGLLWVWVWGLIVRLPWTGTRVGIRVVNSTGAGERAAVHMGALGSIPTFPEVTHKHCYVDLKLHPK